MNNPRFSLNQRVQHHADGTLKGKVISIFIHDTPVPPNVNLPRPSNVWDYLILMDQPAVYTQMWIEESKLEAEKPINTAKPEA